jgi:putative glutamine amidotransferase
VPRPIVGITLDREGEYLRVKHHYHEAIIRAGGLPLFLPFGSDASSVAEVIDGLLIPGGGDIDPSLFGEEPHPSAKPASRERTDFEISLLETIMRKGKPVFGICYGMQVINVALGGDLYQDLDAQLGPAIDHRNGYHEVLGKGPLMNGRFRVNTSHHQAIRKIGRGLETCALSDDDVAEALFLPDHPFFLGVQWHPERLDDDLSRGLFSAFVRRADAGK